MSQLIAHCKTLPVCTCAVQNVDTHFSREQVELILVATAGESTEPRDIRLSLRGPSNRTRSI